MLPRSLESPSAVGSFVHHAALGVVVVALVLLQVASAKTLDLCPSSGDRSLLVTVPVAAADAQLTIVASECTFHDNVVIIGRNAASVFAGAAFDNCTFKKSLIVTSESPPLKLAENGRFLLNNSVVDGAVEFKNFTLGVRSLVELSHSTMTRGLSITGSVLNKSYFSTSILGEFSTMLVSYSTIGTLVKNHLSVAPLFFEGSVKRGASISFESVSFLMNSVHPASGSSLGAGFFLNEHNGPFLPAADADGSNHSSISFFNCGVTSSGSGFLFRSLSAAPEAAIVAGRGSYLLFQNSRVVTSRRGDFCIRFISYGGGERFLSFGPGSFRSVSSTFVGDVHLNVTSGAVLDFRGVNVVYGMLGVYGGDNTMPATRPAIRFITTNATAIFAAQLHFHRVALSGKPGVNVEDYVQVNRVSFSSSDVMEPFLRERLALVPNGFGFDADDYLPTAYLNYAVWQVNEATLTDGAEIAFSKVRSDAYFVRVQFDSVSVESVSRVSFENSQIGIVNDSAAFTYPGKSDKNALVMRRTVFSGGSNLTFFNVTARAPDQGAVLLGDDNVQPFASSHSTVAVLQSWFISDSTVEESDAIPFMFGGNFLEVDNPMTDSTLILADSAFDSAYSESVAVGMSPSAAKPGYGLLNTGVVLRNISGRSTLYIISAVGSNVTIESNLTGIGGLWLAGRQEPAKMLDVFFKPIDDSSDRVGVIRSPYIKFGAVRFDGNHRNMILSGCAEGSSLPPRVIPSVAIYSSAIKSSLRSIRICPCDDGTANSTIPGRSRSLSVHLFNSQLHSQTKLTISGVKIDAPMLDRLKTAAQFQIQLPVIADASVLEVADCSLTDISLYIDFGLSGGSHLKIERVDIFFQALFPPGKHLIFLVSTNAAAGSALLADSASSILVRDSVFVSKRGPSAMVIYTHSSVINAVPGANITFESTTIDCRVQDGVALQLQSANNTHVSHVGNGGAIFFNGCRLMGSVILHFADGTAHFSTSSASTGQQDLRLAKLILRVQSADALGALHFHRQLDSSSGSALDGNIVAVVHTVASNGVALFATLSSSSTSTTKAGLLAVVATLALIDVNYTSPSSSLGVTTAQKAFDANVAPGWPRLYLTDVTIEDGASIVVHDAYFAQLMHERVMIKSGGQFLVDRSIINGTLLPSNGKCVASFTVGVTGKNSSLCISNSVVSALFTKIGPDASPTDSQSCAIGFSSRINTYIGSDSGEVRLINVSVSALTFGVLLETAAPNTQKTAFTAGAKLIISNSSLKMTRFPKWQPELGLKRYYALSCVNFQSASSGGVAFTGGSGLLVANTIIRGIIFLRVRDKGTMAYFTSVTVVQFSVRIETTLDKPGDQSAQFVPRIIFASGSKVFGGGVGGWSGPPCIFNSLILSTANLQVSVLNSSSFRVGSNGEGGSFAPGLVIIRTFSTHEVTLARSFLQLTSVTPIEEQLHVYASNMLQRSGSDPVAALYANELMAIANSSSSRRNKLGGYVMVKTDIRDNSYFGVRSASFLHFESNVFTVNDNSVVHFADCVVDSKTPFEEDGKREPTNGGMLFGKTSFFSSIVVLENIQILRLMPPAVVFSQVTGGNEVLSNATILMRNMNISTADYSDADARDTATSSIVLAHADGVPPTDADSKFIIDSVTVFSAKQGLPSIGGKLQKSFPTSRVTGGLFAIINSSVPRVVLSLDRGNLFIVSSTSASLSLSGTSSPSTSSILLLNDSKVTLGKSCQIGATDAAAMSEMTGEVGNGATVGPYNPSTQVLSTAGTRTKLAEAMEETSARFRAASDLAANLRISIPETGATRILSTICNHSWSMISRPEHNDDSEHPSSQTGSLSPVSDSATPTTSAVLPSRRTSSTTLRVANVEKTQRSFSKTLWSTSMSMTAPAKKFAPAQRKRTVTATVVLLQDVLDEKSAEAVTSSSSATVVAASVVSPAATTQVGRMRAASEVVECGSFFSSDGDSDAKPNQPGGKTEVGVSSEDSEDARPDWFEHPMQVPLPGVANPKTRFHAGSTLMTTCLLILLPAGIVALFRCLAARSATASSPDDDDDVDGADLVRGGYRPLGNAKRSRGVVGAEVTAFAKPLAVASAAQSVLMLYFFPNVVGTAAYLLAAAAATHNNDESQQRKEPAEGAGGGGGAVAVEVAVAVGTAVSACAVVGYCAFNVISQKRFDASCDVVEQQQQRGARAKWTNPLTDDSQPAFDVEEGRSGGDQPGGADSDGDADATAPTTGRSQLKLCFNDRALSSADRCPSIDTLGARAAPGSGTDHHVACYATAFSPFFEATSDPTRPITRCYFFEDLVTAAMASVVANAAPAVQGSCTPLGVLLLLIALFHLGFVVAIRPYRTFLDTGFTIAFGICQALMALLVVIATSTPTTSQSNRKAKSALGIFMFIQLTSFFVEASVQVFWALRLHCRRTQMEEQLRVHNARSNDGDSDGHDGSGDVEMHPKEMAKEVGSSRQRRRATGSNKEGGLLSVPLVDDGDADGMDDAHQNITPQSSAADRRRHQQRETRSNPLQQRDEGRNSNYNAS